MPPASRPVLIHSRVFAESPLFDAIRGEAGKVDVELRAASRQALDECLADVADLLEQSVSACTPCPVSAQERVYAECNTFYDAFADGDSSCQDCILAQAEQLGGQSECEGELEPDPLVTCDAFTDVSDACANAAASAFATVLGACPTCP